MVDVPIATILSEEEFAYNVNMLRNAKYNDFLMNDDY